jgi:hypothetical protein
MPLRRFFGGEAGAHRKAAADRLGDRHDVRLDTGPFMGEQLAGAAHAGLDLVEDQQEALVVAERAQSRRKLRWDRADAALALDRLDQDRRRLVGDRRLQRVHVVERNLIEAFDLGAEALEIFRLAAGGDGRQRPAVERALEGDDAEALGMAGRRSGSAAPS